MTARRYHDSTAVDFVVVGSGASGGVMARELAVAGFSTVVLEQGPRLTPADFEHDELKYWFRAGITNDPARSPQEYGSRHRQACGISKPQPCLLLYSECYIKLLLKAGWPQFRLGGSQ